MSRTRLRSASLLLLAAGVLAGWLVPLSSAAAAALPAEAGKQGTPPPDAALDFANTYAVIVGVLKWEDKSLTPYPTAQRKDRELYDTLRQRGVPADHMALLLDDRATLANMRKALQTIVPQARPESTLLFYYAGHGWRTPDGTQFANYDYHSGKLTKPAFSVREISTTVERQFKGARVLLFADCCHSGGLQEVVQSLARVKIPAAALTSADPLCNSTNNWTFTQTLVDGFRGDPFLDGNGDAAISLGELAREVGLAMEFRERQKHGFASQGIAADYRLAGTDRARKVPAPIAGAFALKEYVLARDGAKRRSGRIIGLQDGKYAVEFFTYSDKEVAHLPASALSHIKYKTYKVGDTLTIARPGLPKARVVEVAGAFHRISYSNRLAGADEWILADQVIDDPRTAAEVEWQEDWYPAIVVKTEKDKYYIHYLGYDDSWNEWVAKERIRFPAKEDGKIRNPFGVADVAHPDGKDVKEFAAGVKLPGGEKDKNAEQWAPKATEGKAGSLDGDWFGRWDNGSGTARIQVVKDHVYVLYTDREGQLKGHTWLLEAVRDGKDRLIGRWVQVGNPQDTGPFVGLIVDNERIDGTWGSGARWDFRRKVKK